MNRQHTWQRNRAKLHAVSSRIRLFVASVTCLVSLAGTCLFAQDSTPTHKKKSSSSSSHKSTSASKKTTSHQPRKKVTAARAHKMKTTFVASNDLRPMARQLVEFRTPAAYTGVENYAHTHAGTEAERWPGSRSATRITSTRNIRRRLRRSRRRSRRSGS